MINKVPPNSAVGYTNGLNRLEGKAEVERQKMQGIEGAAAQVSLSGDALALQRATQAVKDAPEVRADLVQAIRSQLEAGTYRVDVNGLAEKLIPLLK